MNLMKLFNLNYLLQNLKKSKVVLSIFIGLVPILNTIILIMMLSGNSNKVLGFEEISIINFIGIYLLPVIISICLFNYIYKKKSVDFINSMPISRKSIFVTNTILGITIFILMLLVNVILIAILGFIFNTSIPFFMLFDYFWFFLIVYIFSYSATNLAMTISGNAITQVVVTLLLFFLIPFSHFYIVSLSNENLNNDILIECTNDICTPDKYYCYDDIKCNLNKDLNRYQTRLTLVERYNYTTPFGLIFSGTFDSFKLINIVSVMKMLILSVVYIILGYILFVKRKMEVSETSFKNPHIHNLVKSLTLVPIVSFAYIILREEDLIFSVFVLVIILIYYFVYDLITKKSIQNIRLSLIYFVSTIVILTSLFSVVDREKNTDTVLKYNDIKEIAINLNNYSDRFMEEELYVNNKDLIKLVTKEMLDNHDYSNKNNYFKIYLKTKNNKEYKSYINVNNKVYEEIISILSSEKEYINYYKNINIDEVYAVKLGNKLYSKKEAQAYLGLIDKSLKKLSLEDFFELQEKYSDVSDDFYITLYTYDNHDKKEILINGYINYDLLNTIVNSNNALLKDNITTELSSNYSLYYINSYFKDDYNIDYYVLRSAKEDIYKFILEDLGNKVDMRQEYITLQINLDYKSYQFTTNNVEEFRKILDKKYNEIKDTDDYLEYINPYDDKESVEYYD